MANTLRFKRGLVSTIPTALAGEPLFTTDTFDLYIGNGTTNTRFQKYIASGATTQILRGDGSLYTFPLAISSPSAGQVLKYNGTNWVNDSDAGITGSGTTNYLPKFTGASTLGNSLLYDSGTTIGIGTNSPAEFVHIRTSVFGTPLLIENTGSTSAYFGLKNSGGSAYVYSSNNELNFATSASATQRARITSGGNFIINNASTDNGLRFQVTGDGFFSGSVGIGTTGGLSSINFRISKDISGATTAYGQITDGQIQTGVTANGVYSQTTANTAASTTLTNIYYSRLIQGTFGAGSTITNQFGYFVDASLTGATNNFGFYGNIASGTGRWNLYMNGTAANYFNGNLGVGITTPTARVEAVGVSGTTLIRATGADANGNADVEIRSTGTTGSSRLFFGDTAATSGSIIYNHASDAMLFSTASATRATLDASGNLGLGVTPSAWRSTERVFQIGTVGSISQISGAIKMSTNAVWLTGTPTYITSTYSTNYLQNLGEHQWLTAPLGTPGANITFTQAMTLFATGNLAIGTTTDAGFRLDVNGTMRVSGASTLSGGVTLGHTGGVAVTFPGGQAFRSNGGIFIDYGNGGSGDLVFRRGAGVTNTLTLAVADGAATFSSSVTAGGNLLLTNGTASSIGAINLIRTGTSPVASRLTFGTDGTGYSFAISKNQGGTITDLLTILDTGATTFLSSVRAAGFNSSGGNGYQVINSASNTVTALRPTGGGASIMSTNSNGLHIAVGTEASSDLILASNNTERIRLSSNGFFSQLNATNPSASITDSYIQYSADVTAGNAAPHFRTENGAVIKLYQETTAVGNAIFSQGGGNAVLDDSTFAGYTIRQVVQALRNQGILQ